MRNQRELDIMTTTNITKSNAPALGTGATVGCGSDCYPVTVIAVSPSGKTVTVQRDEVFHLSGSDMTGDSVYTTIEDPEGATEVYTLRGNGHYVLKGVGTYARYGNIGFGHRRYYQDPSF